MGRSNNETFLGGSMLMWADESKQTTRSHSIIDEDDKNPRWRRKLVIGIGNASCMDRKRWTATDDWVMVRNN